MDENIENIENIYEIEEVNNSFVLYENGWELFRFETVEAACEYAASLGVI